MRLRNRILSFIIVCLIIMPIFAQGATIDIAPGDTAQGLITDTFFSQRYRFEAQAGQTYTIRMERIESEGSVNTLDPLLFLFDSNEQFLAENDDVAEGNRNAQIIFTPEVEGAYIIEATRFQQEAGTSTGAFRLVLIAGDETIPDPDDDPSTPNPLDTPPEFGVPFTILEYEAPVSGTLASARDNPYFALGGRQGELFNITLATTGDLIADVTISFPNFAIPINRVEAGAVKTIQGIIPQTGWYRIEVAHLSGSGSFTLEATVVGNGLLEDTPLEASFTEEMQSLYFIVNATINERVFVNMTVLSTESGTITPGIAIIDRSGILLDEQSSSGNQTRISLTVPRSGVYYLRASNLADGTGTFRLSLRRNEPNTDKLRVQTAQYNENYTGTIDGDNPIEYYRFSGKQGELVSIQMQAASAASSLDPFLILTDSNLNELAFNDNTGASRTARINQYALPADDDYYILATRPRLSLGGSSGAYEMSLTVGQIALQAGNLTATLVWQGDADLNLFVRAPSGRTVSWANPNIPDGGILQIDSNTGCETPTAQPVEHIYFSDDELTIGDYTVWVWYQNVCASPNPLTFTLTLAVDGEPIFVGTSTPRSPLLLSPGERYETGLRVLSNGNVVVTNPGTITTPSSQQTASQGGDRLIVYSDETVNGAITNEVFAQFYQFQGNAGDTVRICVVRTAGNLDPIVVLRDSLDNNLVTNDDADSDCDSSIVHPLPETATYVVAVSRYGLRDGTTVGEYSLTLTRSTN